MRDNKFAPPFMCFNSWPPVVSVNKVTKASQGRLTGAAIGHGPTFVANLGNQVRHRHRNDVRAKPELAAVGGGELARRCRPTRSGSNDLRGSFGPPRKKQRPISPENPRPPPTCASLNSLKQTTISIIDRDDTNTCKD